MPVPVNKNPDYVELYLATQYTDGDLTLDCYVKNATYTLTDQKTSSLITSFRCIGINRDNANIWMGMAVSNVVTNGTFASVTRYTMTLRQSDSSNPMVGLANTDNATNADANIITANKLASMPPDSLIMVAVGSATMTELYDTFTAGTTTNTAEAGENATILNSVSLDADGKLYKYIKATRPNAVGIANATVSSGAQLTYTTFGGVSTGHAGLTVGANQYAEDTGAITETSSATTTLLGVSETATTIRMVKTADAAAELTQVQAEDSASTAFGTVSGQRLSQAVATGATTSGNFELAGTLTAGDIVRLIDDGGTTKIQKVVDSSFGTDISMDQFAGWYVDTAYDPVEEKILIIYADSADSDKGKGVVGTVTGDVITLGTPVEFDANVIRRVQVEYDTAAEKFLVIYGDETNTDSIGVVATVSGNVVSFGVSSVFDTAGAGSELNLAYDTNAGAFAVFYEVPSKSGLVATISGTTVSYGAKVVFTTDTLDQFSLCCAYDAVAQKTLVMYGSDTNKALAGRVATISGTTISYGTEVDIFTTGETAFGANNTEMSYNSDAGACMFAATIYDLSFAGLTVGTMLITGTDVTLISAQKMGVTLSTISTKISTTYDSGLGMLVVGIPDSLADNIVAVYVGVDQDLNPILHDEIVLDSPTAVNNANGIVYDESSGKCVFAYRKDTTDARLIAFSTSDYFRRIGVVQASGTAGQTKSVSLLGGKSTIHSGLEVDKTYYTSDSATAQSIINTRPLGRATSATDLLLFSSDTEMDDFGQGLRTEVMNQDSVESGTGSKYFTFSHSLSRPVKSIIFQGGGGTASYPIFADSRGSSTGLNSTYVEEKQIQANNTATTLFRSFSSTSTTITITYYQGIAGPVTAIFKGIMFA